MNQILESVPDAIRKPAAVLATALTLAGPSLELPATAEAYPASSPDVPGAIGSHKLPPSGESQRPPEKHAKARGAGKEQDKINPVLIIGIGAFLLISCGATIYSTVGRTTKL
jgi:hypothetical protein